MISALLENGDLSERIRHLPIPELLISDLAEAPLVDEKLLYLPCVLTSELTVKEKETLTYLSHGLTAMMTADAMGISEHTVLSYIKRARFKLRAKNRTHAVANALRQGLIR